MNKYSITETAAQLWIWQGVSSLLMVVSLFVLVLTISPGAAGSVRAEDTAVSQDIPVYRLYYRPTHEHLYTTDAYEKEVLSTQGVWIYEGIGWYAPSEGTPVYRLYHPGTGDHLYTADAYEYAVLPSYGWQQEGICFYSAGADAIPVYRLFSPVLTTGSHHYTLDSYERSVLLDCGLWNDEQIAWHALRAGEPGDARPNAQIAVTEVNLQEGAVTVALSDLWAPGGVASVQLAVWSEADQSNLYWYDVPEIWDGLWLATVTYDHHRALSGTYQIHAYVTGGDGVREMVASTMVEDPFRDVVYVPDTPEMAKARTYMRQYITSDMTREEKLRACFDSFQGKQEKNPWIPHYTGPDWYVRYANSFFDNGWGNCYSFAAAFGYMAKALGHEEVYACCSGGHGWIEIDGLCYDPEWALHHHDLSYYAMPYELSVKQNYLAVLRSGRANARLKME